MSFKQKASKVSAAFNKPFDKAFDKLESTASYKKVTGGITKGFLAGEFTGLAVGVTAVALGATGFIALPILVASGFAGKYAAKKFLPPDHKFNK